MREHFKNRINESALGWIRMMLDGIYNRVPLIESSSNAQDTAQEDYADRFFYELFQNAKDVSGCTKIKIILQNGELLFCNNGLPISDSDFDSLCTHAKSNKRDNAEQTGKYGIGKSSYYNISKDSHRIYSKAFENSQEFDGYCFELASGRAEEYKPVLKNLQFSSSVPFGDAFIIDPKGHTVQYISQIEENDPDGSMRMQGLGYIRKNLAIPLESFPTNIQDLAIDFSTVFCFTPDDFSYVENKLQEFSSEIPKIFLFLPDRVREITVIHNEATTVFYRYKESDISKYGERRICIGQKCNDETAEKRFFVWEKTASTEEMLHIYAGASDKIKKRDPLKVTFAVIPDDIDNEGYYFCDLPTEDTTGMSLYIDANFHISSDRKRVQFSNDYNKKLLEFCARATKDIVQDILLADNGIPSLEPMYLITEMLQPGFKKGKNSEIYQEITNIIDIAMLPCVWGIKENKDLWCAPVELFDALSRNWSDAIQESDFYSRTKLAISDASVSELTKSFVKSVIEKELPQIPTDIQRNILIELLRSNHKDYKKYLQIWQSILDDWSDLIDDEFQDAEIFLDDNGELKTNLNLCFHEDISKLSYPQSIGTIQFPFKKLNKNLSAIIYQHKEKFSNFQNCDTINSKWCHKIVSEMQNSSPELCEELFVILIENFWDNLTNDANLLSRTLFPCNNNEWKFLKDISKGNGWGNKDNVILSFLNLCDSECSFTCLRAPTAKIWTLVSKEKIQYIADERLCDVSIFEKYETEIIVSKNYISSWVKADNCSNLACEVIQSQFENELRRSRYYPSYYAQASFEFFPSSLVKFTSEHAKCFWKFLSNSIQTLKDQISYSIHYEKTASVGAHNLSMPVPLKAFLMSYAWVPGQNGEVYKLDDIILLSKELRNKYPELVALENIMNSEQVSETVRNFLIELGVVQIERECDIGYNEVFRILKDDKQLDKFRNNFWKQLAEGEYHDVKLPSVLPVLDSKGKSSFANIADTQIYIADLSNRENRELRANYSPCLHIDIDTFNNKMFYRNKELFTLYSRLDRQIIVDGKSIEDCSSIRIIDYKNGLLAFTILLFFSNKKYALEEVKSISLIAADSIVKQTGSVHQEIPHYFQNNIIIARKEDWEWAVATELKEWKSRIDNAVLESIIKDIDNMSLSDIINFLTRRHIDFVDEDIVDAKELLWGFGKAKALALQFIPELNGCENEFAEYDSWEDIENKSSRFDLDLLKKFFTSTHPLVQRGKMLAKDYGIDLQEWNTACQKLNEGTYVNEQFSREFNKIRNENIDLFISSILIQTAWQTANHFLYDALQDWKNFDGGNNNERFWTIDMVAFECIMNEFIALNYAPLEQKNSVNEPYAIFKTNKEYWDTTGCNDSIDIRSNEYFLKIYPQEHFEIIVEEQDATEECISEQNKDVVEENIAVTQSLVAQNIPVESTSDISNKPISPYSPIDTDDVRRRISSSIPTESQSKTRISDIETNASRPHRNIESSDLENWTNLKVVFTPYSEAVCSSQESTQNRRSFTRNYATSTEEEHLTEKDKQQIGKVGEICLFAYLQEKYSHVKWVSSNNATGENPDDSLGYDFEIADGEQIKYIECKTSSSSSGTAPIDLGSTELSKAQECLSTKNYSVYRVFPNGESLQIVDLGNPLAEGNTSISISGLKFRWKK